MSYGEFLSLFGLKPSPDVFRFWLMTHMIPPHLEAAVIAKARAEKTMQYDLTRRRYWRRSLWRRVREFVRLLRHGVNINQAWWLSGMGHFN